LPKKISDRFSFSNRLAIFPEKSRSDFHVQIDPRLKNPPRNRSSGVTMTDHDDSDQLNFSQPDRDFSGKIGP